MTRLLALALLATPAHAVPIDPVELEQGWPHVGPAEMAMWLGETYGIHVEPVMYPDCDYVVGIYQWRGVPVECRPLPENPKLPLETFYAAPAPPAYPFGFFRVSGGGAAAPFAAPWWLAGAGGGCCWSGGNDGGDLVVVIPPPGGDIPPHIPPTDPAPVPQPFGAGLLLTALGAFLFGVRGKCPLCAKRGRLELRDGLETCSRCIETDAEELR